MSCEEFGRERYEEELARYLERGLSKPDWVNIVVEHVPVGQAVILGDSGEEEWETIMGLRVLVGSFGFPSYSVLLAELALERGPEEDLGPRFLQALQLLLETCLDADRQLDDERREQLEAAERLEPDPQPQEHDHPCERGESP